MKHAKKLLGLLLALAMVLSLAATAFATGDGVDAAQTENVGNKTEGSTSGSTTGTDVGGNAGDRTQQKGTITITNAVVGQTYRIYKLLNLSYDETTKAYSYKASEKWNTFINSGAIKDTYVAVDPQGYVTWVSGANAAQFAAEAKKAINTSGIQHDGEKKANGTAGATTTLTFENLELGYYLLDSSMGALCSLDSTDTDVEITDKNSAPTVTKQVYEDDPAGLGEKNDASIGETVKFVSVITAGKGADNYTFYDKMSDGLTFIKTGDQQPVVEWTNKNGDNGNPKTETLKPDNDYILTTQADAPGTTVTETFKIQFTATFCEKLEEDDTLTITYYATVNEEAVIAGSGNPNECWVTYGDTGTSTKKAATTTYVWTVGVFKYAKVTESGATTEKPLAGAQFKLCTDTAGTQTVALFNKGNNSYRVAKGDETSVAVITTDVSGRFTIEGLDSGTYYLHETVAPGGYNLPGEPVEIRINADGKVNADTEHPEGVEAVKVLNQSGTELPSTGGVGTTIFYVLGSALLLGAVVLLVARKRMNAEK